MTVMKTHSTYCIQDKEMLYQNMKKIFNKNVGERVTGTDMIKHYNNFL